MKYRFITGCKIQKLLDDSLVEKVQKLLDLNVGDIGRLEHIKNTLEKERTFYSADRKYLEHLTQKYLKDFESLDIEKIEIQDVKESKPILPKKEKHIIEKNNSVHSKTSTPTKVQPVKIRKQIAWVLIGVLVPLLAYSILHFTLSTITSYWSNSILLFYFLVLFQILFPLIIIHPYSKINKKMNGIQIFLLMAVIIIGLSGVFLFLFMWYFVLIIVIPIIEAPLICRHVKRMSKKWNEQFQ